MNGLHWSWPAYGPVLLLLPAAGLLVAWLWRRAHRIAAQQAGPRLDAVAGRPVFRGVAAACAALAATATVVALLRPVTLAATTDVGPDVVLCVDVSRTMAARDALPTRLGLVQAAIAELAAVVRGGRCGLVAFAGKAQLVVPLTADFDAVAQMVDELQPGDLGGGSHPGAAIDLAANLLQRGGRGGDVVVLSDGEDFVGTAAASAAAAAGQGCRVHALGLGDDRGSKVITTLGGAESFLRDAAGSDVITRRESAQLQALARAGRGEFRVLATAADLAVLYRDVLVARAAQTALQRGELAPVQQFTWPLLTALLFWTLRLLLPRRRR